MTKFQAPSLNLAALDGRTAAELIGATSDIALIVDRGGVIRDVCVNSSELVDRGFQGWVGQNWIDTVTDESHEKIQALLSEDNAVSSRQRQVNHRAKNGDSLLVLYSTVALNGEGGRIAVGKDLSSLARMQQRLVNVQQSMERDYARLRQFETRYRLLFQTSTEAIVVASSATFKVVEANPAACNLLAVEESKLIGSGMLRWFEDQPRQQLENALVAIRTSGQPMQISLKGSGDGDSLTANLSLFKTDNHSHLLIRLRSAVEGPAKPKSHPEQESRLLALVESAPDALVVTDSKGNVLTANTEFLDISQLASMEQAVQQPLSHWLGHGDIDLQIIISSLKQHGSVRLYTTQMRGEFGSLTDVEVSSVLVKNDDLDCIGFSIRNVSRRIAANEEVTGQSPRSIDQLTQLVGRVPLKELVRESTEFIEQLCIEAALKLTGNNRASAAEILGLSRQSLYVKLRRYTVDENRSSDKVDE